MRHPLFAANAHLLNRRLKVAGLAVVAIVVVGSFIAYGWHKRLSQQRLLSDKIAYDYEKIVSAAIDEGDLAAYDAVVIKLKEFAHIHPQDIYAILARMQAAKLEVLKQHYQEAAELLSVALRECKEGNLEAIIRLRLARVQGQIKQSDAALLTLEPLKSSSWSVMAQIIIGDIMLTKGDLKGAREAYQEAIKTNFHPGTKMIVQMKLREIGLGDGEA